MKKNIVVYYLLMLLLVMGAFASMALNSYGVALMSYAAAGFGIALLYELILLLPRRAALAALEGSMMGLELFSLSVLCFLYAASGLMISVPLSDKVTYFFLVMLAGINIFNLFQTRKQINEGPFGFRMSLLLYFIALILLVAAAVFRGNLAMYMSLAAFSCLVGFLVLGWRAVIIEGEETSAVQKVQRFRNKSGLQLVGFGLIIAYYSLNTLHMLPPLYFGSMPNGYAKVVTQQGKDSKLPDPKVFEEAYKRFIKGK